MYAAERQQWLLDRTRDRGRVDVAAVAEELDVTPETIRRDLGGLERQGLVRRVHGGAIPSDLLNFEPGVGQRDSQYGAEKERIAKAAVAELGTAATILLDAGTTTSRLAGALPRERDLTVVTNSLPIASSLAGRPNVHLRLLGGRVRGTTLATVDDWANSVLADLVVDVAFLGTNSFSPTRGLTTPDPDEGATKRAMLRAARRSVVLADASKFGADQFVRFGTPAEIDTLITDTGLDPADAAALEAAGPKVVRA
ncbi:Transcriptional repressor of the fructose operon, DeoR family [Pseudonocardia sp. Ae168_Ps1]|uniref:DeoR/GlpR family DNA-binding transcription regulator n=1 Tax=unclassified Pseudonocardia TaxID=2619320 RepID=UPI00094AF440|nr:MULTISPECIES: DeoR/GlpR family DNA-binding transcription regulator [unclassified Pseudonocardia]OLL74744.1 Transcriptional repressor of the fructose operon, DeoR family [Pseudonocardia sp. Ae150A_Ps1]OLL80726.1 Transcriptional repressor of the fructose operon, DeoR family [Pseudonocardia sp. Ae168_Ps1]OLL85147.1 Transcriptional repressor of the fructose operon, DeoR family [Pseudonocardia sp. Ae263_Ps1]OLL94828.1 Transcriptional repressor of the fructose operon, DeoR family [Pseudonocardia s